MNYAYSLLARREYSVYGIQKKLKLWFDRHKPDESSFQGREALVGKVVRALQEKKYLSDERFAQLFIEQKKEINGWGKQKIWQKLREKGVDESIFLQRWERQNTDQVSRKIKVDVQNKWKSLFTKKLTEHERKQVLLRFLAGRGFGYSESKNILEVVEGEFSL